MEGLVIYSKPSCVYCTKAKKLAKKINLPFSEIDITNDSDAYAFVKDNGFDTVPQIYLEGQHIGGFDVFLEYVNQLGFAISEADLED